MQFLKFFISLLALASSINVYGLSPEAQTQIEHLVESNPRQLSVNEYSLIAEQLFKTGPCNMLVFGVGNDSSLWMDFNRAGKTMFLEDNREWLKKICEMHQGIDVQLVQYHTKRTQWKELLENEAALFMLLPDEIMNTKWDIIFVDAPAGYNFNTTGRMKSIYMAALLAKTHRNTHVYVHDCDRNVEAIYSTTFLGDENLTETTDRLRHYYIE